jgi:uncharacterized protein (TIGR02145 family)
MLREICKFKIRVFVRMIWAFNMNYKIRICYCIFLLIGIVFILTNCHNSRNSHFVKDIDGNIYRTVEIGRKRWLAENLKTTRYNNGSEIPLVTEQSEWIRLNRGAYSPYNNDRSYADTFGLLYNWYAVNTGNLCPVGWRVPSDEEWKELEANADTKYGIGDTMWNKPGLRGFDAGQRLRAVSGWRPGVPGTDDLGFSALPGGEHLTRFFAGGSSGFWWSSTEASDKSAWYRSLIYSFEYVARDSHPKRMGFSVRCISDK